MDIVEFFQLSSGKWFSQRTNHRLTLEKLEVGKSTIQIELLDKTDPAVMQLCQQCQIDPELAACGLRVTWDGTLETVSTKQTGAKVLVSVPDTDKPNQGKLLSQAGSKAASDAGRYSIGDDEALTLITESESLYSEERLWFVSPNLRLRTTVLKQPDGVSSAFFCSEIRMGLTKPAAES